MLRRTLSCLNKLLGRTDAHARTFAPSCERC